MKTFKVAILAIPLAISLTGCAIYRHRVKIISEPPGARIEINNNYVGETPLEADIYYGQNHIIKATPRSPGQYIQTKYVPGHNLPKKIFFDMRFLSAPMEYEVETKEKVGQQQLEEASLLFQKMEERRREQEERESEIIQKQIELLNKPPSGSGSDPIHIKIDKY